MPLRYIGTWGKAQWAVWEITEPESALWRSLALSPAESAYLTSIRHERRRQESLAARVARTHLPPLGYNSLSHSYPWAAAATAPYPVAIDIERLRAFPLPVQDYFVHPIDREALESTHFTYWHIWCAKEVAYKLLCNRFDNISFRRDLRFGGSWVAFEREAMQVRIDLHFEKSEEWLLALGCEQERLETM